MQFRTWSPTPEHSDAGSATGEELLVTFDRARADRVLILPALFDEANKLRRFTLTVMRSLDDAGVDSALPDWPGCNESAAALPVQTLAGWREGARRVAGVFGATHILAIRGGALLTPPDLPGWRYAALEGPKLLGGLLRARTLAAREAGRRETRETLMQRGRVRGLTLGGWEFGPKLLKELETSALPDGSRLTDIEQAQLGGPALWLRAEPDEDAAQSAALAALIAEGLGHSKGAR